MEFDSWLSVVNYTANPGLLPARQIFVGNGTKTNLYFIVQAKDDEGLTAAWSVSFAEELKDTISASTVYTMALTASIMGVVLLIFGAGALFFFCYRVPPSPQMQRI